MSSDRCPTCGHAYLAPVVERLTEKAKEMRSAIDHIELALNGIDRFESLGELWENAKPDLPIKVAMTVATMRQIRNAFDELNRIINSPAYEPANLAK